MKPQPPSNRRETGSAGPLAVPPRGGSAAGASGGIHFVDDYLPALLARASQLISGEFHRMAQERGVSVSEWRVLASLAGSPPISISQLAAVSVTKQPTATRLIDRMEARGHVKRLAHDSDRRVTLVAITPAGMRQVGGLIKLAREHEHRVLEPFGLQHAADLKATLKKMIALHAQGAGDEAADDPA